MCGRLELMVETSYVVIIPSKNGEATIEQTLQSLLGQTIPPKKIIVIDDASTDGNPQVLKKFPEILTIRLVHNLPRNFARVPELVNLGISRISKPCSYAMISGDDCIYQQNYVELLLKEFERDSQLLICSGSHMRQKIVEKASPHGSGRIIRYSFLKDVLPFPESIGWESWILFKALQNGGRVERISNVSYQHLRPYSSSSVWTFGQSMYELGYPFWFVFGRFVKNVLFEPNKLRQFHMFRGFLEYKLERKPKLDVANFVANYQRQRIKKLIEKVVK